MTIHVLILCTHNSARSVLAEGMLTHWAGKLGRDVQAHSAASAPSGRINPLALEVLNHAGMATSTCRSKSWDEFSADGAPPLAIVITVCDNAAAETCPVFFGGGAGKRRAFELTRQAIGYRMLQLLAMPLGSMDRSALQAALDEISRS